MKAFRPFFFIVAFVLIVGLACVIGGSETPAPAPTQPPAANTEAPQPTAPPTAEPTAEPPTEVPPTDVPAPTEVPPTEAPQAEQYFTEDFANGLADDVWTSIVEGENQDKASFGADSGGFKIDLQGANTKVKIEYLAYEYTDVRIDVSTDNRGKNTGAVLLICRASDEGWYQTQIANDGRYWIHAYDKIGIIKKGINLIANGGSKYIKSGRAKNDYTFICNGNTLILGVNGIEEKRIKDTKFNLSSGHIAFGLESVNSLPIITIFSDLQISQP
jgi:hypothetical protein